jgi:hypothetical protein
MLPAASVPNRGANAFDIIVRGQTPPIEVTDLEIRYDYQNDLDPIWQRGPAQP